MRARARGSAQIGAFLAWIGNVFGAIVSPFGSMDWIWAYLFVAARFSLFRASRAPCRSHRDAIGIYRGRC